MNSTILCVESQKIAHIETDTIFLIGVTASGKSTLANMLALKDSDFTIPVDPQQ